MTTVATIDPNILQRQQQQQQTPRGNGAAADTERRKLSYTGLLSTPGRGLRIFYNVADGQLDAAGDAALRAMHLDNPFAFGRRPDDLLTYTQLVSRPYFFCKLLFPDGDDEYADEAVPPLAALAVGATARLAFARPPRSKEEADQPSTPFDLSSSTNTEPIVVFDDATLVPLLLCRVVEAEVPRRGAASGIVSVVKEASE